ncbi:DNA translocase FtsK [Olsenella sp. Marseille-P4559]|uniref:DNA translocase FtsK n=1 Tax=Olsenella sp. Marseille-P4559 TaxID=2364795 RepID=UPI00102F8D12|nr:DNA translocase FtsK [Olsenella sp. Marseille-P4559]
MPSNRRSNAAGKAARNGSKARGAAPRQAGRGRGAADKDQQGLSSTQNDIVGVALAVIAVAMFVSLVVPTSAIVTSMVGHALSQLFGAGAILAPIALFIFACTFFMDEDGPISGRVAGGLVLIVLSVLALLSLNHPGVADAPSIALSALTVESAGGYVGGFFSYVLVRFVGAIVGNVILVGVIVVGAVICGFSVSGAVAKIHLRAQEASENRRLAREQRDAELAAARELAPSAPAPAATVAHTQGSLFDETGEGETSFIGARKTSVLRRGRPKKADAVAAAEENASEAGATTLLDDAAATTLLDPSARAKKSRGSKEKADAPASLPARSAASRAGQPSVSATTDDGRELPPPDMLKVNPNSGVSAESDEELSAVAAKLQGTLEEFGLTSRVVGWVAGPSVTTFKIEMGEGERVSKITNLQDDIALSLASRSVRIFAPIPGTSLVGIEIPNKTTQPVYLGDVLPYVKGGPLEAAFGRDSEGKTVVVDIAGLPHLLVAGTTGSGKSVLLNSIVMTILMRATPEEVRLIMVDPKRVEFTYYAGLPHLYVPVVTEPNKAASALSWGVTEMERRLKVFEHYKVRDIKSYNHAINSGKYADMENPPKHMPYFVIVIDELSDLMMVAGKDVEASIVRIAQLGRAAGIHLIVATQRPSADVVTGLIKANIDNRVALSVDNGMNSRIILDQTGAERLLGHGDMLYKLRGLRPRRAQGCFVSEGEVERVVSFIKEHHDTDYHDDILTAVSPMTPGGPSEPSAPVDDPLLWEAADIVVNSQLGSTSSLQRALSVGYARAGRIMDMLENKGIVGPANGSKPRDVLLDKEGLEGLKAAEQDFEEV